MIIRQTLKDPVYGSEVVVTLEYSGNDTSEFEKLSPSEQFEFLEKSGRITRVYTTRYAKDEESGVVLVENSQWLPITEGLYVEKHCEIPGLSHVYILLICDGYLGSVNPDTVKEGDDADLCKVFGQAPKKGLSAATQEDYEKQLEELKNYEPVLSEKDKQDLEDAKKLVDDPERKKEALAKLEKLGLTKEDLEVLL